jgi:hypothetical protein
LVFQHSQKQFGFRNDGFEGSFGWEIAIVPGTGRI